MTLESGSGCRDTLMTHNLEIGHAAGTSLLSNPAALGLQKLHFDNPELLTSRILTYRMHQQPTPISDLHQMGSDGSPPVAHTATRAAKIVGKQVGDLKDERRRNRAVTTSSCEIRDYRSGARTGSTQLILTLSASIAAARTTNFRFPVLSASAACCQMSSPARLTLIR